MKTGGSSLTAQPPDVQPQCCCCDAACDEAVPGQPTDRREIRCYHPPPDLRSQQPQHVVTWRVGSSLTNKQWVGEHPNKHEFGHLLHVNQGCRVLTRPQPSAIDWFFFVYSGTIITVPGSNSATQLSSGSHGANLQFTTGVMISDNQVSGNSVAML